MDSATDRLRFALSVPNFADPEHLVDLGVAAEARGWDGVFFWDHAHGSPDMPVPIADSWVVLGALAIRTERIRLGTAITPPARRHPQKLAREVVTVDHLSGGRITLGVGLGEPPDEYEAYGDDADRSQLAARLDESLEVLARMWSGEPFEFHGEHVTVERAQFLPRPVQDQIPVWASCTTPHRAPLRRAARYHGAILATVGAGGMVEPTPAEIVAESVGELRRLRGGDSRPLDIVVGHPGIPEQAELAALREAGATWVMPTGWMDDLPEIIEGLPSTARST